MKKYRELETIKLKSNSKSSSNAWKCPAGFQSYWPAWTLYFKGKIANWTTQHWKMRCLICPQTIDSKTKKYCSDCGRHCYQKKYQNYRLYQK